LFVAGLILGLWGRRRLARTAAGISVGPAVSWVLALNLGIMLLIVPMLLLTVSVETDNVGGWLFPVLNKRWLAGLYNLAVVTVALFPVAIERWRSLPEAAAPAPVQSTLTPVATRRRGWSATAGIVAIVAVAWYFTGHRGTLSGFTGGLTGTNNSISGRCRPSRRAICLTSDQPQSCTALALRS
jgi:hypothetical protein